jgi:hypothetical protein
MICKAGVCVTDGSSLIGCSQLKQLFKTGIALRPDEPIKTLIRLISDFKIPVMSRLYLLILIVACVNVYTSKHNGLHSCPPH